MHQDFTMKGETLKQYFLLTRGIAVTVFSISIQLYPVVKQQSSIQQTIKEIIKPIPGNIGISALHIESKQRVCINDDQFFPMASTYKLPIALYFLSLVDSGKCNLQTKKKVTKYNVRRYCFIQPNQNLSLKKLVQLMLSKSDNAASDMIFNLVGGGKTLTQWLQKQGINNMQIDRSTLKMLADYAGVTNLGDEHRCTVQHDRQIHQRVSKKNQLKALHKFYIDKCDTTTPRAMVDLLEKLHGKKMISINSRNFLLDCMQQCSNGKCMKPLLPQDITVWHKTGAMDGMVSDVGIIKLSGKKGHLALAFYSNKSIIMKAERENAFARIAKVLVDHFSMNV